MDLDLTADDIAFREEFKAWLDLNLPTDWRHLGVGGYREEDDGAIQREWQQRLHAARWLQPGWPEADGGRGASPMQQAIYHEELARAGAPPLIGRLGVTMAAPVLREAGSPWQREEYLQRILSGEEVWCQGFSEPDAGSDLASLRTRAERRPGGWVLNGQKTWSSGAHYSDRSFLLARTETQGPPHRGIGYFIVNMRQSGIEVRGIRQMTGGGEFCEIFLHDAWVDDRDVVGEPGDGWRLAMLTFAFERGGLANAARFEHVASELVNLARQLGVERVPRVRTRLAQARIETHVFRANGLRALSRAQRGEAPGPEASLTKLYWSEMDKRLQETAVEIQGMRGALGPSDPGSIEEGRWQYAWIWAQAETVYAGASEIQRNIIAERVLGLPRSR